MQIKKREERLSQSHKKRERKEREERDSDRKKGDRKRERDRVKQREKRENEKFSKIAFILKFVEKMRYTQKQIIEKGCTMV